MKKPLAQRIDEAVIEGWFRDPPRMVAAMASQPSVGVVRAFVLQWCKFSKLFPRWVGAIMSNCPEPAVIAYEVENLMTEVVRDPAGSANHYELLVRLGEGVDLRRGEIESYPALPESSATFDWLWTQARQPDWLVGFTAVNGLEILGDRSLPARYGVSSGTGLAPGPYGRTLGLGDETLEFFEVSEQADAGHGHETVALIARYTPPGREDEIVAVLTATMARLRRMMDAMLGLATSIDAELTKRGDDGKG